jgi:formamidopyrimidine-DNA glycosylase
MAELPELEICRREAEKVIAGRKIKTVEVLPAAVKRFGTKKAFITRLTGVKVGSASRVGVSLVFKLDSGDGLIIELGPTGMLLKGQTKDPAPKGLVATITFTQHGVVRVVDPAKASTMTVVPWDEVGDAAGIEGFDLAGEPIPWTAFGERLLRRKDPVKAILMDPKFLAGIGPIYSDEVLFESGLRATRTPDTLTPQEIRRMYRAAVEIVHEAIKHGGSTVGPDGWTDMSGGAGGYTPMLAVHGREGLISPRAREPIVKEKFGSGVTYYCAQTQM